uniref:Tyramine betahydroxylaselike [Nasonia vitripennis] n=1 Tax=Lepeophtheirus salmonis TaxID=72036 RepID=A0A0K2T4R5_LEPSM
MSFLVVKAMNGQRQGWSSYLFGFLIQYSLFFLSASTPTYFLNPSFPIYSLQLRPDLLYQWQIVEDEIIVEVDYLSEEGKDWVAVGFSDYGELRNADLCVAWMNWKGQHFLEDAHTNENYTMLLDEYQDCRDFEYQEFSNGRLSFKFTRPLHPCHNGHDKKEDYVIEDGTVHVVWAKGKGSLYEVNGLNLSDRGIAKSGFERTRLLKVDTKFIESSDNVVRLNITHTVDISNDDTTYWCSSHKLNPSIMSKKHHIIEYLPRISEGNEDVIHHMEIFQCDASLELEFPIWSGPCGDKSAPPELQMCKKVLAAWAIGAGSFEYPREAGIAFGGPQTSPYMMMEVHFNNPSRRSGIHDESGMTLIITPELRKYDAGILELGLIYSDLMAIPPYAVNFPLSGHCLPQCTAVGLPEEGIIIFGSQLHTHQTGARVVTKHFRNGEELPEINRDNHYSTHFQEIRLLHEPRKVFPGDYLKTTCFYDTTHKTNVTLGGFGFEEEMCVNYVHYYPRTNLEICKSSVDSMALDKYFQFLNEWNNEDTDPLKSVNDNYESVKWTPLQSVTLRNFYEASSEMMQCTGGSGTGLPGKWKEMNKPKTSSDEYESEKKICSSSHEVYKDQFNIKSKKNTKKELDIDDGNYPWSPNQAATDIQQFNPSFTRLIKKKELSSSYLDSNIQDFNPLFRKRNKEALAYPEIEPTFTRLIKKARIPSIVTKKPWSPKALRMKKDYSFGLARRRKRIGSPMNEMKKREFETFGIERINDESHLVNSYGLDQKLLKRKNFMNEKEEFLKYFQNEFPKLIRQLNRKNSPLRKRGEIFDDYDSWGIDKRSRNRDGLGSIPLPI